MPPACAQVRVEGLDGTGYTDSLQGGKALTQDGPVVFREEVDRIYLKTPEAIKVRLTAACRRARGRLGRRVRPPARGR